MNTDHTSILREALRREFTCANGKRLVSEADIDEFIATVHALRDRADGLSPDEQIRRNPALALDDAEKNFDRRAVIAELLRWMKCPEAARGKSYYVPDDHPSGLGGQTIYVPKDFPLPCATK